MRWPKQSFITLTVATPHFTQVPQDDWGGYPGGGKDDEIPCRRMRSSSYVKAMGDEESGESDSSPKASPQKFVRPDALVKAIIRPRDMLDSQRYNTCDFESSIVLCSSSFLHVSLFMYSAHVEGRCRKANLVRRDNSSRNPTLILCLEIWK